MNNLDAALKIEKTTDSAPKINDHLPPYIITMNENLAHGFESRSVFGQSRITQPLHKQSSEAPLVGVISAAQGSSVPLLSWIYGFSADDPTFAYSGCRQPISACGGQLTGRRALVICSSDSMTRRRGGQKWPLCPCDPRLRSIYCLRLAARVITRLPE